ncbi:branched-chain amino acid ABC transporter permease [Neisseria sp. Ec49-e6-T10]|uniref:branched-chain amino acid ABC transporter permease n=1 Tax=Neisseria sp. Ec49-e6-T10 TaxID=3140744 RepID=UPI003EBD7C60
MSDQFMQLLFNGLIVGSIYGLIALGYTMVYGIMGLINFAHGEVVMIGGMITISFLSMFIGAGVTMPGAVLILCSLLLALPICMFMGYAIERVAYRPLRNAPRLAPLITAVGLSIVLQQVAAMVWGTNYIAFPHVIKNASRNIGGAQVTDLQIVIIIVCIVLMGSLLLLVNKTKLGRAMRATSQRPDVAALMGVSVNKVVSMTFIIGAALGSVAGVMQAANYDQLHYTSGFLIGLKAFSAAVLGGIGNLGGAVAGGLILGIAESFFAGTVSSWSFGVLGSHYQDIFAFLVLVVVLIFRPSGLLGEKQADRA